MLCLGSLKVMKWRQLVWIAFCVLELAGNASGNSTVPLTPPAMAAETSSSSSSSFVADSGAPAAPSTPQPSAADKSLAASSTLPRLRSDSTSVQPSLHSSLQPSAATSTQPLGTPLDFNNTSHEAATSEKPATQPSTARETPRATSELMTSSITSGHPPASTATTTLHTARDSPKTITCHNVREVSDTGAICLQLNESSTCKHFLEEKGSALWSAICEGSSHPVPSPCQIKLAKSEVDHDCLLLILVGERDPATDVLQESHWEKFGIKSLKRGSVRNHQDFSQKTLIALVTSGLLLAFLGLAGYLLMKRRSWSPAGERLA
ncbi:hematopoietic progenitor cell antigen CD34 isoform X3 [Pogoniulus pusillus]